MASMIPARSCRSIAARMALRDVSPLSAVIASITSIFSLRMARANSSSVIGMSQRGFSPDQALFLLGRYARSGEFGSFKICIQRGPGNSARLPELHQRQGLLGIHRFFEQIRVELDLD